METFVRRYQQVDINLVMGTGSGLVTPVLKDVQSRGLSSISREIIGFEDSLFSDSGAEIEASKLAVGTFSIHNLGKFSVLIFYLLNISNGRLVKVYLVYKL